MSAPQIVPRQAVPRADDCRCECGSLLARWVDGGVEVKCRRCKRTVLVPLGPRPGRWVRAVPVSPSEGAD